VVAAAGTALFSLGIRGPVHCAAEDGPFDLAVRGGRVVDGSGSPAQFADIGVRAGRIAQVGRIGRATQDIDASGLIVAPGFIDVHTHSENVLQRRHGANFTRMGATTLVIGNCGGSTPDVAQFFRRLEEGGAGVNVATLIGHNTVRTAAMGGAFDRVPTEAELDAMRKAVDRAMRDGAVGLSTGLIYLPGTFAKTGEITELARVAARHDGIYVSHMRNEGNRIFEALDELFQIARDAKIRAEVSHIKLGGKSMWGKADQVLAKIEEARGLGLDITQDQYVYTASSTGISSLIPAFAREGGAAEFRKRIADPEQKAKVIAGMKQALQARQQESYDYAVIASYRGDPSLNGKTIPEAAQLKRGAAGLEDQIELILEIERSGGAGGVFHGMSEPDVLTFLKHPNTMFASDSSIHEPDATVPHPRGYGNNARVLGRYVREQKALRLEDAIRRMTSLPAAAFRLPDRGQVRPGAWADLVAFDPATVTDEATYSAPHRYATGFRHVLVNGVPVVRDGKSTSELPGKAVRRSGGVPPDP
jgi:N-acyl-D-amino-acid deacylase